MTKTDIKYLQNLLEQMYRHYDDEKLYPFLYDLFDKKVISPGLEKKKLARFLPVQ